MNQNRNPGVEPPASKFSQLVMMLATSALQLMGRLPNPSTGKPETHMDDAQATIDVIEMLAQKTKGNLEADEEALLGETLTSLRLAYVQLIQGGPSAPASPPEEASVPAEPAAPGPAPETSGVEPAPADTEEKKPKFQKKYD